tara:strand:+ start:22936 stop:23853 length:918 start_codon:yes stop_codon:yes gene_type:complete
MYDVVILTDSRYLNPKKTNWYINQVLVEDKILLKELEKYNLKVTKKDWSDKKFNWKKTRYAIFRTTWDYFDKFDKFIKWFEKTKKETLFINSKEIIHWNLNKTYLLELSKKGINIAKTIFVEQKQKITLKDLFKKTQFNEAIIKPSISGAARDTFKITKKNYNKFESNFQNLINKESFLFQEFLKDIEIFGEISIILIDGEYTHAVRKIAKKGDFRVQDDHGGIVEAYNPVQEEIEFAKRCISECPSQPIYARVDLIYDNKKNISLGELELIEPELWFRNNTKSAKLLAKKISNLVSSKLKQKLQ